MSDAGVRIGFVDHIVGTLRTTRRFGPDAEGSGQSAIE
jgi:hypothetical protein